MNLLVLLLILVLVLRPPRVAAANTIYEHVWYDWYLTSRRVRQYIVVHSGRITLCMNFAKLSSIGSTAILEASSTHHRRRRESPPRTAAAKHANSVGSKRIAAAVSTMSPRPGWISPDSGGLARTRQHRKTACSPWLGWKKGAPSRTCANAVSHLQILSPRPTFSREFVEIFERLFASVFGGPRLMGHLWDKSCLAGLGSCSI